MNSIEQHQSGELARGKSRFGLGVVTGVAGTIILPLFLGSIIHLILVVAVVVAALIGCVAIGKKLLA